MGNEDVTAEYKEIVYNALRNLGVSNPETLSVKQMNNVGSCIARMPLSSFTALGIWFDQDYMDSCDTNERLFQIYHEAAHYAQKHHQKLLAFSVAALGLSGIGLKLLHSYLRKQNVSHAGSITAATATATLLAFFAGLLPYVVKLQERDADLIAAQNLVELGYSDIVKEYIQSLRNDASQSLTWWFSDNQQADYLENALRN